jgi:predicted transcriptional regulator
MTQAERSELKKWMQAHGKTATGVAAELMVTETTIRRILSGKTKKPHRALLVALKNMMEDDNGQAD